MKSEVLTYMVFRREDAGYKIPRNSFMHNCQEESSGANNKREVLKRREKRGLSGEKSKRSWMPWS